MTQKLGREQRGRGFIHRILAIPRLETRQRHTLSHRTFHRSTSIHFHGSIPISNERVFSGPDARVYTGLPPENPSPPPLFPSPPPHPFYRMKGLYDAFSVSQTEPPILSNTGPSPCLQGESVFLPIFTSTTLFCGCESEGLGLEEEAAEGLVDHLSESNKHTH
jgi:hypothetical protein